MFVDLNYFMFSELSEESIINPDPDADQCCGSGMFIPDPNFFHPGSRVPGSKRFPDPDPHQRI
jgi:hypothetical protein